MIDTRGIERPWTFKIEFSRGCNLSCTFCPIHALPEYNADKRFLTLALATTIARQAQELNPTPRIELTMRGEPTLNPQCVEIVAVLRRLIPLAQISMFSNGVRFLKDTLLPARLLDAGVNILNVDCYNGTYDRFRKLFTGATGDSTYRARVVDFRAFSAYQRHPHGERLRVINLVPDIADPAKLVKVRVLHNNAGNVDPVVALAEHGIQPMTAPLAKGCARPFRECAITCDGEMVLCCHDWRADCVLGNVQTERLEAIWYGDKHRDVLKALHAKDRSGTPCNRCDYNGGFRLGLLTNPNV